MTKFRAAFWISDDSQSSILLTGEDQSHMSDDDLIESARAELIANGGSEKGGVLVVGEWRA